MGLGTIYLLCFAGVVLFLNSGDRSVRDPNNSLILALLAHTRLAVLKHVPPDA